MGHELLFNLPKQPPLPNPENDYADMDEDGIPEDSYDDFFDEYFDTEAEEEAIDEATERLVDEYQQKAA